MQDQFPRTEARYIWPGLIRSLKPVEHGFEPQKHAPIFLTRTPDVSAVRDYLSSIRVDLRDRKVLPNNADELLKLCWRAFDTTEFRRRPKSNRKQSEIQLNNESMRAAVSLADEFHGKTLADLWAKYDEVSKEIGEAEARKEEHDELKIYAWLLTSVFNNTVINHWEEVTGKRFERLALEKPGTGYEGESQETEKTHAERTVTFLQYLHDWAKKREESEISAEAQITSRLEEAGKIPGSYLLTEKERGKLDRLAAQLIANNNPRALDMLDAEALRMHNNKFDRLSAREPYAQLQLPKKLRLLKTDPQRNAILFAAVHHMTEGLHPDAVSALFPSLPSKPTKTASVEKKPEQKPKTRFPFVEALSISDDEKATANRLLRAQAEQLTEKRFGEFLHTLEQRVKNGDYVLDAIRKMHAEFHPKEKKETPIAQALPKPIVQTSQKPRSLEEILAEIDSILERPQGFVTNEHITELKTAAKRELRTAPTELLVRAAEHTMLAKMSEGETTKIIFGKSIARHAPDFFGGHRSTAVKNLISQVRLEHNGRNYYAVAKRLQGRYRIRK
jgi:hypothetical protein